MNTKKIEKAGKSYENKRYLFQDYYSNTPLEGYPALFKKIGIRMQKL